jgi:hypothetical protein
MRLGSIENSCWSGETERRRTRVGTASQDHGSPSYLVRALRHEDKGWVAAAHCFVGEVTAAVNELSYVVVASLARAVQE